VVSMVSGCIDMVIRNNDSLDGISAIPSPWQSEGPVCGNDHSGRVLSSFGIAF
jgi:hypothetical protein